MDHSPLKLKLSAVVTTVVAASVCMPAAAGAATALPPENSAANQYTETIPTGGGKEDTGGGGGGGRSAAGVLGAKQAKDLRAQGAAGAAVAEVVVETAPEVVVVTEEPVAAKAAKGDSSTNAKPGRKALGDAEAVPDQVAATPPIDDPGGASALSSILAEATGSSSGQLGLLLPLLIIASAIWALVYRLRTPGRI